MSDDVDIALAAPSRAGGPMRKQAVHYAGAVQTPRMRILAGWAACCSGDRAVRIRAEGRNTRDPAAVTCRACLRTMAKATADGGE